MVLVAILVVPVSWVLIGISTGSAAVARWIAVLGVGVVLARVAWSTSDAGPALLIAVLPLLTVTVVVAGILAYSWPRATTRAVRDCAHRNGWRLVDPRDLRLPPLPLPVGRTWSARNVVQTQDCLAFEVRWLHWNGLLCRRRRLSAFVATLPVGSRSRSTCTTTGGSVPRNPAAGCGSGGAASTRHPVRRCSG